MFSARERLTMRLALLAMWWDAVDATRRADKLFS